MPDAIRIDRAPVGRTAHGVRHPLRTPPEVSEGLLERWHERNREVTLPHGIAMLEEYGNLDNLRRLTGESDAEFRGMLFADSDVYKTLEAAAWEMGRQPDAELQAFFDRTVGLIERAQQDDGYLDSAYLARDDREPWSDFAQGHELYCLGHLIQAAVAAHRAIDDDRLLAVAERFVDHVVDRMGSADSVEYCGHPLIETALVELHRTTGDEAPLRLAEAFVRRRGAGFLGGVTFGAVYYQDEKPALEATTMRGHAVRALYLNQGVTDLYLETGDPEMLRIVQTQWDDMVSKRMYVTGGTGARHEDEAFGEAFELPPDRAYAETCAGVALFGWAWRMYLATGSAACLDVAETALYNAAAAGISATGDSFNYVNPLQVRDERPFGGAAPEARGRWFSCACCPPNLMRTFATLESHLATERADGIDIALYGSATLTAHGARVRVDTGYPADGSVRIRVEHGADQGFRRLALRLPGWAEAEAVILHRDGARIEPLIEDGWMLIDDALVDGTEFELSLPIRTTVIHPDPRVDAIRGTVAVRRGPVVFCAVGDVDGVVVDAADLAGADIDTCAEGSMLGPRLTAPATRLRLGDPAVLYSDRPPVTPSEQTTLQLRPFAEFDGGSAMRVWLPAGSA
ncbi:beta-L-arabinofuranosidase domain-containing protein [Microbacterium sp. NPDC089318]